jgi:hypothetical protein
MIWLSMSSVCLALPSTAPHSILQAVLYLQAEEPESVEFPEGLCKGGRTTFSAYLKCSSVHCRDSCSNDIDKSVVTRQFQFR